MDQKFKKIGFLLKILDTTPIKITVQKRIKDIRIVYIFLRVWNRPDSIPRLQNLLLFS
jgi:hypothetical protein